MIPNSADSRLSSKLYSILEKNPLFQTIFSKADQIDLPQWYVAGGCVTQTVWNHLIGNSPFHGLRDVDIVYFCQNVGINEERQHSQRVSELLGELPIGMDITNQASVHSWYPQKFGYSIDPYQSVEEGISKWLPAFSLGVRIRNGLFEVYAPFGLLDLFEMRVRPNKTQITEPIYHKMINRLRADWPEVRYEFWNEKE